jgi:hypothetical protein
MDSSKLVPSVVCELENNSAKGSILPMPISKQTIFDNDALCQLGCAGKNYNIFRTHELLVMVSWRDRNSLIRQVTQTVRLA